MLSRDLLCAMGLCTFCASIPLKLFSTDRDKQCTIEHCPSFAALQESGAAGCEFCQLLLHACKTQSGDGAHARLSELCSRKGSVTLASTKFDGQLVQIDYKEVGGLRGRVAPPEWCRAHSPPKYGEAVVYADSRRRTKPFRFRSLPGQGDTHHQLLVRHLREPPSRMF